MATLTVLVDHPLQVDDRLPHIDILILLLSFPNITNLIMLQDIDRCCLDGVSELSLSGFMFSFPTNSSSETQNYIIFQIADSLIQNLSR